MSNQLPGSTGPLQGVPALGKETGTDILRIIRTLADGTVVVSLGGGGGGATPVEIAPYTTLGGGTKTVAASGTPEALAASSSVAVVLVQALETNTDRVRIGPTGAEVIGLYPLDIAVLSIDDPAKIFVRVDVNGEGVAFLTLA